MATRRVVRLASSIVPKLSLLPFLKAFSRLLPFNNSSLIREYVKTFASTAIPIPSIKAAIPGRVKTPPTNQNAAKTSSVYKSIDTAEIKPAKLYIPISC